MPANSSLNIPNLLSLFRIALIPIFVAIFYLPIPGNHLICALIFAVAAFTDWLDGYLARRLNQMSRFGAFIDPVADKLIVAIALILLVAQEPVPWFTIPALIIVGREIVVSALREWMAELGKRTNIAVIKVAKYKTAAQMVAIFLLILAHPDRINTFQQVTMMSGYVLLYIAAILTLWSMVIYLKAAWRDLWG
ncbi:MAG: CDP-diacylglycerol--glycerol-3-phosphate 3-phosphatidyltransferase [Gammaproteobacteria bacterium]